MKNLPAQADACANIRPAKVFAKVEEPVCAIALESSNLKMAIGASVRLCRHQKQVADLKAIGLVIF